MVNEKLTANSVQSQELASAGDGALSPPVMLALAYAPASVKAYWTGFLELDKRLARIVAQSTEPMLAQIRLAWWREMFGRPTGEWPAGEPLLARLAAWDAERSGLAALADGWEAMVGEAPLPATSFAALSDGRARAMIGLARLGKSSSDEKIVERTAYRWSLADIALHLSDEREYAQAMSLLAASEPTGGRLDKALRPLSVLRTLAERAATDRRANGGAGDFLAAVRAGLTGR